MFCKGDVYGNVVFFCMGFICGKYGDERLDTVVIEDEDGQIYKERTEGHQSEDMVPHSDRAPFDCDFTSDVICDGEIRKLEIENVQKESNQWCQRECKGEKGNITELNRIVSPDDSQIWDLAHSQGSFDLLLKN